MPLLPVLLLNDGESLSLARVLASGKVQELRSPLDVPVGNPVAGRFFSTPDLVVDQHRQGLRLLPRGAVPALPPPPDDVAHLPATVLAGGRGFIRVMDEVHTERGSYFTTSELVLFEEGTWRRQPLPDWLFADDVAYEHDWGWISIGRRRGKPVLWQVDRASEMDVPWRFPWWSPHISDGSHLSVRRPGARLVIEQDHGMMERRVTTTYLRTHDGFLRRYVGDDGAREVFDEAGQLPEILLGSGRWLTRRGKRLKVLPRLAVADEAGRALATAHSSMWDRVAAIDGIVIALVSLWPGGTKLLLHGKPPQPLQLVRSWQGQNKKPVDLTAAEVSSFEWLE